MMLFRLIIPAFVLAVCTQTTAEAQSFSGGQSVHQRVNQEALSAIRDKNNKQERKIINDKVTEVDARVEETNAEIERMKNEVTAKDNAIDLLTRRMVLMCRKMGMPASECDMTNPVTEEKVTAENSFCYSKNNAGNFPAGTFIYADFDKDGNIVSGYSINNNFEIPVGSSKSVLVKKHTSSTADTPLTSKTLKCDTDKVAIYKKERSSGFRTKRTKVGEETKAALVLDSRKASSCKKDGSAMSCANVGKWTDDIKLKSSSGSGGRASCTAAAGSSCVKGSECYAGSWRYRCSKMKTCSRAKIRRCE